MTSEVVDVVADLDRDRPARRRLETLTELLADSAPTAAVASLVTALAAGPRTRDLAVRLAAATSRPE